VRDVPVPRALAELRGPLQGSVDLPARIFWSGPDPRVVRWNLADPACRHAASYYPPTAAFVRRAVSISASAARPARLTSARVAGM